MTDILYTLGYESSTIDDFVATLKSVGIKQIIDVREYPLSRKKGFSKNTLHAILEANNIEYVHLKGLGDPKEGRDAARAGDLKKFLRVFNLHMKSEKAQEDLTSAIEIAQENISCLLCYERMPEDCHRTIVANAIVVKTKQSIKPIGVRVGIAKQQKFKTMYPDFAYA